MESKDYKLQTYECILTLTTSKNYICISQHLETIKDDYGLL